MQNEGRRLQSINGCFDRIKVFPALGQHQHFASLLDSFAYFVGNGMSDAPSPRDLAAAIRARVSSGSRAYLELPAREPMREIPQLGRQPR